jgi:hypothetical protein
MHSTRAPKATSCAVQPSYPWTRPCIAATVTGPPAPGSSPITSRPGCPATRDTGNSGISPYGITVGFRSASAKAPSPDPSTTAASGGVSLLPRIHASAYASRS